LGSLQGRSVAILGLAYKEGTDTLRRSSAIELATALKAEGAHVQVYDPLVATLPDGLSDDLPLSSSASEAVTGVQAVVIETAWAGLKDQIWIDLVSRMSRPIVIDANGLLAGELSVLPGVIYVSVGRMTDRSYRLA